MKLKQLLLISLVAIPLFSCGGSKDPDDPVDPVIDYTVTEDEFNHAISFEGVDYLQISSQKVDADLEEKMVNKCAPDACSYVCIETKFSPYYERRIFRSKNKEDYSYRGYSNNDQVTPTWSVMDESEAEMFFRSPAEFSLSLVIEKLGGDYHSFTTKDNFYYARFEQYNYELEKEVFEDLYLHFENKILTSFKQIDYIKEDMTQVLSGEANVTYEKEDIIEPFVPPTSKIAII